jgi:hypothetical protein
VIDEAGDLDETLSFLDKDKLLEIIGNVSVTYAFDKEYRLISMSIDNAKLDLAQALGDEVEADMEVSEFSISMGLDLHFSKFGEIKENSIKVPNDVKDEAVGPYDDVYAKWDDADMAELSVEILMALSDQDVFDKMYGYACRGNVSTYGDGEKMRGVTITFKPEELEDGTWGFNLGDGILNMFVRTDNSIAEEIEYLYKEPDYEKGGTLKTMTDLYDKLIAGIGKTVEVKSDTYHNAEYTVFVEFAQNGHLIDLNVYGEWSKK